MKKLILIIVGIFFTVSLLEAQTMNRYRTGFWDVSPSGGFITPVGIFADIYKPSGRAGIDLAYRVNKEVGLYGNFTYNALRTKDPNGPKSSYLEATVGPRYYFMHPKLKSSLFLEGGVGAYIFNQETHSINSPDGVTEIPGTSDTRPGVNAGIGGTLNVSDNIDIFVRSKYATIFRTGGTSSFIATDGGLTIRF
jgi:hypothetical protein